MMGEEQWEKGMKEMLRDVDHKQYMAKCLVKAPLIVRVVEVVGWRRLRGKLLDFKTCNTEEFSNLTSLTT